MKPLQLGEWSVKSAIEPRPWWVGRPLIGRLLWVWKISIGLGNDPDWCGCWVSWGMGLSSGAMLTFPSLTICHTTWWGCGFPKPFRWRSDLKDSFTPIYALAQFQHHFISFSCCSKHLCYLQMENRALGEASIFKLTLLLWVGLDL